jgi:DNA replication protein DnaC
MERNLRRRGMTVSMQFRYKASPEQIAFDDKRVDKNQILRLADCEFIKRNENIIITGSTGNNNFFRY